MDVLLPVRAPAPWLGESVLSVAGQTYSNWSLLVVLDGPDETAAALIRSHVPDAQVVAVPEGSGLVRTLNHGLAISTADLIARIDADDVMKPERLEMQTRYLGALPRCVGVSSAVDLIDEHGVRTGTRSTQSQAGPVTKRLRWRSALIHPATTFRRAAAVEVGGYSPNALHLEDYELWLRLATVGELHAMPDVLTSYRIHAGQVTRHVRFDDGAVRQLSTARQELARSRGESVVAARLRQRIWIGRQWMGGRARLP